MVEDENLLTGSSRLDCAAPRGEVLSKIPCANAVLDGEAAVSPHVTNDYTTVVGSRPVGCKAEQFRFWWRDAGFSG